eukprot:Amastigsp_a176730_141.p4 type:complete len:106 gc:universal Amastigsp_a176730_141:1184-1501(+)
MVSVDAHMRRSEAPHGVEPEFRQREPLPLVGRESHSKLIGPATLAKESELRRVPRRKRSGSARGICSATALASATLNGKERDSRAGEHKPEHQSHNRDHSLREPC